MSVLVITSQKGGVGKTTLTLNLGPAFAARGHRTLIVDADPQGGIGLSLTKNSERRAQGLVQVLNGNENLEACVKATRLPNFSILPFGSLEISKIGEWHRSQEDGSRFNTFFSHLKSHFDVILVDTAPGPQGSTLGCLTSADFCLCPLQAEPLALRSLSQWLEMVGQVQAQGGRLSIAGLVPMMVQSADSISLQAVQELFSLFPGKVVLDSFIPRDTIFLKASAMGLPVGLTQRRPPAVSSVFDQIATELESRIGLAILEEEGYEPAPLLD